MFKQCILAKFEYKGLPEGLTDAFVENLLYGSSDENFAVTFDNNGEEYWSLYSVLKYRGSYGKAARIQVTPSTGSTYSRDEGDFILFSEFKTPVVPDIFYVKAHTELIRRINMALVQHVEASQLIATIYANSTQEAEDLKSYYKKFSGVKVVEPKSNALSVNTPVNFVQFDITPRGAELEQLKRDIENDLFLRIGVYTGTDKTHITNYEVQSSEQVVDLINAYKLKRRQDFCKRYNAWLIQHNITRELSVELHKVVTEKIEGGE